jgi:anti-sigma-K factor RskA
MSSTSGAGGNDVFRDDAAAYVLGALTAEEHERFTIHLEDCPECRAEVDRLQVVADALPLAAAQLSAPEGLKQRVMSAVATQAAGTDVERAEAVGTAESAPSLRRGRVARVPRAARRSPRRWAIGVAGGLAAAAVVLAVIALATAGGGAGTRTIRAEVLARGASASLRIDAGRAELLVNGMPQVPARRTYQVWVQRGGSPQPTDALFSVSSSGGATVAVPGGVSGARAVLVTAEPLGGSRAPTSPPVIVARL